MNWRGVFNRCRHAARTGLKAEGVYARPIIPLLLVLLLGMMLAPCRPGLQGWAATVFVLSAIRMAVCIRRHRGSCLAPLFMFLALGYLSLQVWLTPRLPPHHVGHFSGDQKRRISGIVVDRPVHRPGRARFCLEAKKIWQEGASLTVTGKIRVTVIGGHDAVFTHVRQGDRVLLNGRIRPIRNFNNPGGFDYKQYMAFKGIRHSTYCRASELAVLASEPPGTIGRMLAHQRRNVTELISMTPQGVHRSVMEALLIGDRRNISPELRDDFHRVGVAHLLAISGLHIGIVAAMAFYLFRRFFSVFPILLWSAWSRKLAAICTFLPVLFYAGLAGMSPSTQRATLMVLVFLSTFLFERDQDAINTLAAAALAILIVTPPALFTLSFQLSFAAVFSILFGMRHVSYARNHAADRLGYDRRHRMLSRLVNFILISTFATLGTLPPVLYHFNQISVIGIPANCIFIPLIGFAVVPAGLAGVFLAPISATAATGCMNLAAAVLAPTLKGIAVLADLPFAAVHLLTPSWLEITCFYGFLGTLSYLIFRRDQPHGAGYATTRRPDSDRKGPPVPGLKTGRHRKMAAAGLIIVLAVAVGDTLYWVHQRFWRDDLRISVLDVGQGSAAVVEFPQGHTMLVDGGGFSDNSVFDVGQRIVAPFLWQKKIRTVETLVLTHPNSDHLNGLLFIADHFHVRQVWTNGETHTTQGYRMFEEIIAHRNIHRPELSDLLRGRSINGVSIDILYPPRDYLQRRAKESWRSLNNNSLVLRIRIGRHAFLFPGDISKRAEKELVDLAGEHLKSAVLCVPHHGSDSSSGSEFIEAVAPRIGVFCVGWQNRFKFPNLHVIERYRRRGVDLLRTDRDGAIEFVTDGRRFSLSTYLTGRHRVLPARMGLDQNDS